MKKTERVERYSVMARVFHWVHVTAFITLVVTGIFLYVPWIGAVAQDSWTRVIHRIGAVLFMGMPILFFLVRPRSAIETIKEGLTWGKEDFGWVAAAPRYYFLGDEAAMPPQGRVNSGQKLWFLLLMLTGPVFVITGILMWFFQDTLPSAVFQWSVFAHDVSFIATVCFFFVHIYLSVLHPLMSGVFSSMTNGKVTKEFAQAHYAKWYEEKAKEEKPSGGK
ncbi:MAG: formate dehydrogenase subunit gamma [Chloroflexota bacterium]